MTTPEAPRGGPALAETRPAAAARKRVATTPAATRQEAARTPVARRAVPAESPPAKATRAKRARTSPALDGSSHTASKMAKASPACARQAATRTARTVAPSIKSAFPSPAPGTARARWLRASSAARVTSATRAPLVRAATRRPAITPTARAPARTIPACRIRAPGTTPFVRSWMAQPAAAAKRNFTWLGRSVSRTKAARRAHAAGMACVATQAAW
jgi:hypothetical protein